MRRHAQEVGVRKWAGGDLVELQAETLKALDGFLGQYGPSVIKGCEITAHESTFDVAPGLVVLSGVDHQGHSITMIAPFKGAAGVALPLYLTLSYIVRERTYADGKVKPIAYDYHAQATSIAPGEEVAHLVITAQSTPRFVDVLQDENHSFITDIERTVWNGKANLSHVNNLGASLRTEFAAADATILVASRADAATKSEAALRSANEHTNGREVVVRNDMATADVAVLNSAKSYANQTVAALVDSSPEALNTLQELATAMGNDPNFATTVMTEIGKRVTTEAFTTALTGKFGGYAGMLDSPDAAPLNAIFHTDYMASNVPIHGKYAVGFTMAIDNNPTFANQIASCGGQWWIRYRHVSGWGEWSMLYHSGNLGLATSASDGLMAKEDKMRLSSISSTSAAGTVSADGECTSYKGNASAVLEGSIYVIRHGPTPGDRYVVTLTSRTADRNFVVQYKGASLFEVRCTTFANVIAQGAFDFKIEEY